MTGEIEKGFEAGLEGLALANTVVRFGTDARELPGEATAVIIDAGEVRHLTPALWHGTVFFRVNSPALARDIEAHTAKEKAVADWLGGTPEFSSQTLNLSGLWVGAVRTFEEDNRWVSEIECAAGFQNI